MDEIVSSLRQVGLSSQCSVYFAAKIMALAEEMERAGKAPVNAEAICTSALDVWGGTLQTVVAMEEMAELTKALCKAERGDDVPDAIAEEIADVSIMLDQMALLHGVSDQIPALRERKLLRLQERISNWRTAMESRICR